VCETVTMFDQHHEKKNCQSHLFPLSMTILFAPRVSLSHMAPENATCDLGSCEQMVRHEWQAAIAVCRGVAKASNEMIEVMMVFVGWRMGL